MAPTLGLNRGLNCAQRYTNEAMSQANSNLYYPFHHHWYHPVCNTSHILWSQMHQISTFTWKGRRASSSLAIDTHDPTSDLSYLCCSSPPNLQLDIQHHSASHTSKQSRALLYFHSLRAFTVVHGSLALAFKSPQLPLSFPPSSLSLFNHPTAHSALDGRLP